MTFGDLKRAVQAYRDECEKHGNRPGKAMCSYFIFIGEGKDEDYGTRCTDKTRTHEVSRLRRPSSVEQRAV